MTEVMPFYKAKATADSLLGMTDRKAKAEAEAKAEADSLLGMTTREAKAKSKSKGQGGFELCSNAC